MTAPLLHRLLDIELLPVDEGPLHLVWEHPLPGWAWTLVALAAAGCGWWAYSRMQGGRAGRSVLAAVRAAILLLVVVLLAGPMAELRREHVEPDWLLVLADRSASMTIGDVGDAGTTRDAQLRAVLADRTAAWERLGRDRVVRWMGFHGAAFALGEGAVPPDPGGAAGERTNLRAALDQALQRAAARPVSGIVLLSDGRTDDPPDRALLRRLQSEAIPVHVLPLGSPDPVGDLALRRVDAPRRAFVRDKVPVAVEIDRLGTTAGGATLRLIDDLTGETLDEIRLEADDPRERVVLTAEPALGGEASWTVRLDGDRPDLVPQNNVRSLLVELVDRPLRVMFVEGYPRWEYRYLKNLLIREESIDSSVMLLSADRDFAQEGNVPIARLPRSAEEFAQFDVVVIGDVPAGFFATDQLDLLRAHVAERGAGLLWIAGARATPSTWGGTALADLLPIRGALALPAIDGPVTIEPTDLADRLGVLRLASSDGTIGWPRELSDPAWGWSRLWWAQRIDPARLKPTAEVLARTVDPEGGTPLPIVVHLRYGAGQSIYVASDEIWRWRYGRGEFYPDQFWIQMIRMLGRESLESAGAETILEVNPRRVEIGRPVRATLRVLDERLVDARRANVAAQLVDAAGEAVAEVELRLVAGDEREYAASFVPPTRGDFQLRLEDPAFADAAAAAPLEVFARDDELRRPETDHDLLARLAAETGGRVLAADGDDLETLELPNRSIRTLDPLRERLWDAPLVFALLLLLLTMEWVGRKFLRLA